MPPTVIRRPRARRWIAPHFDLISEHIDLPPVIERDDRENLAAAAALR
jgi:hypothetical protein